MPHARPARRVPLDRLAGAHDALAVEQLGAAPLLVHRRDVALVEVPEALDHLADGRLDGEDLDVGVLLLEERADAHEGAARAQSGHEVGDLGAVAPRSRGRWSRSGPGGWPRWRTGRGRPSRGAPRPAPAPGGPRRWSPRAPGDGMISRPEHLEQLAPLDRDVLRQHDLDRVALEPGDHRHGDAGVARRRLDDRLARGEGAVGLGLLDHPQGDAVLDRARRVLALHLRRGCARRVGAEHGDVDHRRVADHVEHRGVHSHRGGPSGGCRSATRSRSTIVDREGRDSTRRPGPRAPRRSHRRRMR